MLQSHPVRPVAVHHLIINHHLLFWVRERVIQMGGCLIAANNKVPFNDKKHALKRVAKMLELCTKTIDKKPIDKKHLGVQVNVDEELYYIWMEDTALSGDKTSSDYFVSIKGKVFDSWDGKRKGWFARFEAIEHQPKRHKISKEEAT